LTLLAVLAEGSVKHRGLQAAEAEVEVALFHQRAREAMRARVAGHRLAVDCWAAGESEAQKLRDLVERLAGRVVARRAEQFQIQRVAAAEERGVSAADDQAGAREDVAAGGEA